MTPRFATITLLAVLGGCAANAVTLGSTQPTSPRVGRGLNGRQRISTAPLSSTPISVGSRSLGLVTRAHAAMNAIDSVVTDWGWTVQRTDAGTDLRTDWLYMSGPEVSQTYTSRCEDGAQAGLRLWVHRGRISGDTTELVVQGDALAPANGDERADGERLARRAFDQSVDALIAAVVRSTADPDTVKATETGTHGTVGVSKRGGVRLDCATIVR